MQGAAGSGAGALTGDFSTTSTLHTCLERASRRSSTTEKHTAQTQDSQLAKSHRLQLVTLDQYAYTPATHSMCLWGPHTPLCRLWFSCSRPLMRDTSSPCSPAPAPVLWTHTHTHTQRGVAVTGTARRQPGTHTAAWATQHPVQSRRPFDSTKPLRAKPTTPTNGQS